MPLSSVLFILGHYRCHLNVTSARSASKVRIFGTYKSVLYPVYVQCTLLHFLVDVQEIFLILQPYLELIHYLEALRVRFPKTLILKPINSWTPPNRSLLPVILFESCSACLVPPCLSVLVGASHSEVDRRLTGPNARAQVKTQLEC